MGYAVQFYDALLEKSRKTNIEMYSDTTNWTKTMKEWITEIIKILNPDSETSFEYYRIDVIGWTQLKNTSKYDYLKNKCDIAGMNFHLWNLEFAIEHENEHEKWIDEVCKLAYIKCPLRIIISYGTENAEDKIQITKMILKELNAFDNNQQEFAIILGNRVDKFKENDHNPCGYRLYIIKNDI